MGYKTIIVNKRMIVKIFNGDNKSQRSLVKATKSKANPGSYVGAC